MQSIDRADPVVLLKVAAVINGLKTTKAEATECYMRIPVNGSAINTRKVIIAALFSLGLVDAALFALFFAMCAKMTCIVRVDPLDPLWPVHCIVHSRLDALSVNRVKRSENDEDGPFRAGSLWSNGEPSTNDENVPQISVAGLEQKITPQRHPASGPRVLLNSTESITRGSSCRIYLRFSVVSLAVGDNGEYNSYTTRCLSRYSRFRSSKLQMPNALRDDFWIGTQEDPERRVGRYFPYGNAMFDSLKNYQGHID